MSYDKLTFKKKSQNIINHKSFTNSNTILAKSNEYEVELYYYIYKKKLYYYTNFYELNNICKTKPKYIQL